MDAGYIIVNEHDPAYVVLRVMSRTKAHRTGRFLWTDDRSQAKVWTTMEAAERNAAKRGGRVEPVRGA